MKARRVIVAAAVLVPAVAVLGLLAYGFALESKYIPSPLLGRPASRFTLSLLEGTTLRLNDLRGQVVFVTFWASWCPPCREEAPAIQALWRTYQGQGVVFVGINTQDEEPRAKAFIEEFGLTYANGMDRGGTIAIDYGVWGLPEAFFVDAEGRITSKHVGALAARTIAAKIEEARRGVLSAKEGRGEYQSIR